MRRSMSRRPRPSPGSRSRSSPAGLRSSRWYSSLLIASMRSRSAVPPSRANSSRSRRPYLTVIVCQPAASNMPSRRPTAMSGTTRSSDCRLRSMIHSTSPRRGDHRDRRAPPRSRPRRARRRRRARRGGRPAARRSARRRSAARARSRAWRSRRSRPSPSRSRRGPGPCPARVALQPAELAQSRQVAAVERAEQVVDRVQHRRGVRLHRDAVGRAQVLEVERRHDADHRRRRGLVPADLHARRGRRAPCWRGGPCSSRATARAAARRRGRRATTVHGVVEASARFGHGLAGIQRSPRACAGQQRPNRPCDARFERRRAFCV